MPKVPWWWPFFAALGVGVALLIVAVMDAPQARRFTAVGSVFEAAGAVLLGVPLIKTSSKADSLSSTPSVMGFDDIFPGVQNAELRDDLRHGSLMGICGLVLLVIGFGVQFTAQLFF